MTKPDQKTSGQDKPLSIYRDLQPEAGPSGQTHARFASAKPEQTAEIILERAASFPPKSTRSHSSTIEGIGDQVAKVAKVDYISNMMDEEYLRQFVEMNPPLGCVPGGFIYTPNLEEYLRRQQHGLWFWSDDMVAYYESQMKWEKEIGAPVRAGLTPEMRKALGYE
jgi:hypothetical protein